jgi:TPR repeat protein
MGFDVGKSETVDRLISAGRTLLTRGDTKFTVVRLCAEARVSVDEFRHSFGNKSALFKAMLETQEPKTDRPPIEDLWVERRLRNFEHGLRMFETRSKEARHNHALAIARLEEKLGTIDRQIREPKRAPAAPPIDPTRSSAPRPALQPWPEYREKWTPESVPRRASFGMGEPSREEKEEFLEQARRALVRHTREIQKQLARRISPRTPTLATILFVVLALLAGIVLLHTARAKMTGRDAADQNASANPVTSLMARAGSGDAKAQSALAFAYLRGNGVKRDIGAAIYWSQAAAAKGDPDAEYLIGSLIQSGTGIARDPQQAFTWFRRSADAGNVKAMHNLAIAYVQGNGTPKDATAAATWFARAASAGYMDSAFDLAVLYEQGLGVPQNEQQALHWYRVAANAGDRTAAARAHMLETAGNP